MRRNSPLENYYNIREDTGCWEWRGCLRRDGYGSYRTGLKITLAHRHVYTKHKGTIPEGLELDHLCRNRKCVNPEHLEPVEPRVNARRSSGTKVTPDLVREIRAYYKDNKVSQKSVGVRFGISQAQVWNIVTGNQWSDIK